MGKKKAPGKHIYSGGAALSNKNAPDAAIDKKNDGSGTQCPFCPKLYKQHDRLVQHLQRHHPDQFREKQEQDRQIEEQRKAEDAKKRSASYPTKTPKNWLYEYCQKHKLAVPKFKTSPKGSNFVTQVAIRQSHIDNKAEDILIKDRDSYASEQESQQSAAVAMLHKIAGERQWELILPAQWRDKWDGEKRYASEAAEKQRIAQAAREEARKAHATVARALVPLAKLWLPVDLQQQIEAFLRRCTEQENVWAIQRSEQSKSKSSEQCTVELQGLGFPISWAQEAATINHGCVKSSLDWLCLNAPSEILPKGFAPSLSMPVIFVKNRTVSSTSKNSESKGEGPSSESRSVHDDHEDMEAPWVNFAEAEGINLDRLKQLLKVDKLGPKLSGGAKSRLWQSLLSIADENYSGGVAAGPDNALTSPAVKEEIETCKAIYDQDFDLDSKHQNKWTISTKQSAESAAQQSIKCFTMELSVNYPNTAPFNVDFQCNNWNAAEKALALYRLAHQALALSGEPMFFLLFSSFYDTVDSIREEFAELMEKARNPVVTDVPKAGPVLKSNSSSIPKPGSQYKQPRNSHSTSGKRISRSEGSGPSLSSKMKAGSVLAQVVQSRAASKAFVQSQRKNLPATLHRSQILKLIENNRVVLVRGATGCGKSTQVPQFILENAVEQNQQTDVNVIVTQPRRIATIGVANRVADELESKVGQTVGYSIRLENKTSAMTKLLFCTTGVLLRRIQSSPKLPGISHIVVDEVHERSLESDFLLILLKRILAHNQTLKVVLMSATVDTGLFTTYFQGCTSIDVPGRTFPVDSYFLEQCLEKTGFEIKPRSKYAYSKKEVEQRFDEQRQKNELNMSSGLAHLNAEGALQAMDSKTANDTLANLDPVQKSIMLVNDSILNTDLIERIVVLAFTHAQFKSVRQQGKSKGSLLVFLPGMAEIGAVHDSLSRSRVINEAGLKLDIHRLHSSVPAEQQRKVFLAPKDDAFKVVLSTNIAETSVTIDDCTFVVDCGRAKSLTVEGNGRVTALRDGWISKASAQQRAGRAGRVRPGICFKLYLQNTFQKMEENETPEILRLPLDNIILHIMSMGEKNPSRILQMAVQPPPASAVDKAISLLEDIQAVKSVDDVTNHEKPNRDKELTPLGHLLAQMPTDACLGKLLLLGAMFRCLQFATDVAAVLSHRSPFSVPHEKRGEFEASRRQWVVGGENSDHMAICRVVQAWRSAKTNGIRAEARFCEENFVSMTAIRTIDDLAQQLECSVVAAGLVPKEYLNGDAPERAEYNRNDGREHIMRAIICGAFYPSLLKIKPPKQKLKETAHGTVEVDGEAKQNQMFSKEERIFAHPASVLFNTSKFKFPLLSFMELSRTSKTFVREGTMVSPFSALFFGRKLEVVHDRNCIVLDDWLCFEAPAVIGVILKAMKTHFELALQNKFENVTGGDGSEEFVLRAFEQLLQAE